MPLANGAYTRTNGASPDNKMFPQFLTREIQDHVATAREGRPIYRTEERVQIVMPGNMLTRPEMAVTEEHKQRWPAQYEAFKKGEDFTHEGTSLKLWPILGKAQVAELNAINIYTIEQVAELPDGVVQRLGMGGLRMRELAQAYFDDAKANALSTSLARENDEMRAAQAADRLQLEEQGRLLASLSQQLIAMQNAPNSNQSYIPGNHDPVEMGKRAPVQEVAGSALDSLNLPARRGRPPKEARAA